METEIINPCRSKPLSLWPFVMPQRERIQWPSAHVSELRSPISRTGSPRPGLCEPVVVTVTALTEEKLTESLGSDHREPPEQGLGVVVTMATPAPPSGLDAGRRPMSPCLIMALSNKYIRSRYSRLGFLFDFLIKELIR